MLGIILDQTVFISWSNYVLSGPSRNQRVNKKKNLNYGCSYEKMAMGCAGVRTIEKESTNFVFYKNKMIFIYSN
jgi:hypothetical protein